MRAMHHSSAQPGLMNGLADAKRPEAQLVSPVPPLLVRRRDAARLCSLSPASWDRLNSAGLTPRPIKLGGAVLWRVEELRAWCEAGCPPRDEWEARQTKG